MKRSIQTPPFIQGDSSADLDALNFLFQAYLGRSPELPQIERLRDGQNMSVAQIEATLCNSSEYRNRGRLIHHDFRGAPDATILMVESARIFFLPIAKVANSSIKHWLLCLSGEELSKLGHVHEYLDRGYSKIQIRHWPRAYVDARMQDPSWSRVAVLRDPEERLVSSYWDKFVSDRTNPTTLFHTAPVYRFFYGQDPTEEQVARGLSFRQFCQYINHVPRHEMDAHWAAQHRYLENFRWDRLFTIDRIAEFERFVLNRCPAELQHLRLGRRNVAAPHSERSTEDVSNRLPCEFTDMRRPSNASFLAPDIRVFIADYYALDNVLIAQAQEQQNA